MAKTKKRIETNAKQEPLTHLGAIEIDLPKLPPGPEGRQKSLNLFGSGAASFFVESAPSQWQDGDRH